MGNITVSVIVPIYNVENYLAECLDSLERQTLKNIEVILVNDGSTDGSAEIAGKYVARNRNFTLINRENGGLSAARNTGMKTASGEYLYFLDSDDYLLDDALETLYAKAEAEQLDVLKFSAYCFTEPSRELTWTHEKGYKYSGSYPEVYNGQKALQLFIDNHDNYPSCCLFLARREIIENNGLSFCEGIIHEDALFHYELLSLCSRVAVFNKPFYCRRYREGSITTASDLVQRMRSFCIGAEASDRFCDEHGFDGFVHDWHICFFVSLLILCWEKMNREGRRAPEVGEYCARAGRIAKKHSYANSRKIRFFVASRTLFQTYLWASRMKGLIQAKGLVV